jgi:hypothetical protein
MNPLFDRWEPKLLTPAIGRQIREWNERGAQANPMERLAKQARSTAEDGMKAYEAFWGGLTKEQKTALKDGHTGNKQVAQEADRLAAEQPPDFDPTERPDQLRTPPPLPDIPTVAARPDPVPLVIGTKVRWDGKLWAVVDIGEGHDWSEVR